MSGEVKLGNMGLANLETTETPGTPFWTAPEIFEAEGAVDGFPADIYAFGVLLTELDTCQLPYFDQDVHDAAAFVRGVVNGTLRPTLTAASEPWLRRLVEMCLLGDPAARPTAATIVEMLSAEMAAVPGMSVAETYLRAVARDDVNAVIQLLENGTSLDETLPGGASLLLAATTARAATTVQLLLDGGADVNNLSGGQSPLHEAATRGNANLLVTLINAGADVDCRDHEGKTPLLCAFRTGSELCIKELVATGADVNLAATNGTTPLQMAQANLADVVPMLKHAASRQENAVAPEIFCVNCGNWHPIEAACTTCGHEASTHERVVAILRRLMRLHHRGCVVDWDKTCAACHETTMTIVDSLCPKCLHQQQDANELKKLQELLKKALKSIAPRRVRPLTSILNTDSKFMGGQAGKDIPLIPRSIPRWLAQNNEPPASPSAYLAALALRDVQVSLPST
ncbi:hypothetical protein SPRG_14508 [Saprolegnia parasitica CBS 223.65]|uniref:Protein kinase domain-containing protein n=1 Tax=Saprolegnia parasitica (strain CBS 223.65) TaxID=695850 RepID=A0A067BTL9_SAPPC|nr:hypothetical protein SPRG_14508 [Saprolegnia parasitica CBS 223.65]KDO20160.1 hypothetical protein SPRG_14508 [Saprolegnia parasitica CBS 223.65]|eukprot:XP_012209109.1 hypothetical protein SPRG_14508 [Saprolegnia parasitica CBS 223.65]